MDRPSDFTETVLAQHDLAQLAVNPNISKGTRIVKEQISLPPELQHLVEKRIEEDRRRRDRRSAANEVAAERRVAERRTETRRTGE